MTKMDWDQECPLGVSRDVAAQHGKCATCQQFEMAGKNCFPNKCNWGGWKIWAVQE
jgi:hypothetical protein